MSKGRLLSGRVKKLGKNELDPGRYDFINAANAEPDLGSPDFDGAMLISNSDGERFWTDNIRIDLTGNIAVGTISNNDGSSAIRVLDSIIIEQDLIVQGTTTTISSQTLEVVDKNIELAVNATTLSEIDGAGITINGPETPITIAYDSATDRLVVNRVIEATVTDITTDVITSQDLLAEEEVESQDLVLLYDTSEDEYKKVSVDSITNQGSDGFTGSQGIQGLRGFTGSFGYTGSLGDQGPIGFTGSQGPPGPGGVDGAGGFTGSQGNTGFVGSRGFTGSQGVDGFTGSQGDQGFTGSFGYTGSLGDQGPIGFTGSQGPPGPGGVDGAGGFTGSQGNTGFVGSQGFAGSQGFTGSQGYTGSQGGIVYSFFSDQGDIFVTGLTGSSPDIELVRGRLYYFDFSNVDNTIPIAIRLGNGNQSPIEGSDNNDAVSGVIDIITYRVPLDAPATLIYERADDNTLTGTLNVRDEAGYAGSQGIQGPIGFTGSIGYTGSLGDQGPIGFTGSQGPPGPGGVDGAGGFTGSQGNTGFVGSRGFTGSQGVIGFTGSQGVIGFTGSQGIQGDQGIQGFTGSQGLQGFVGSRGFSGSQGDAGETGFTGSIGYTGSLGDQGPIGFTGSQGPPGPGGTDGTGGFTGSQGITGFIGSRGFTGSQGDTGDTGFTGSIGFTGSQGDQGIQGFTGSQGLQGFTGSAGFTGSIGFTGSRGIEGGGLFEFSSDGFNYNVQGFVGSFPSLTLIRGNLYYFDVTNISSSHPFALRISDGNISAVPGTVNNDPVNGYSGDEYIIYRVPYDAPDTIVYQCVNHSSMIGTINISEPVGDVSLDELTDVTITNPITGQVLKYDGNAWINDDTAEGEGSSVTISDTPPSNPGEGDLWFNSTLLETFVWYVDENSAQWVSANPTAVTDSVATVLFGDVYGVDSTLLVDGNSSEIVGNINNSSTAIFSGEVNFTNADIRGITDKIGSREIFVAADDSTQRQVNLGETIKIAGGNGISTSSDAEGNIIISTTIEGGEITGDIIQNFFVAADDSTQREINLGETIKISGGEGITTTSDEEGNIVIASSAGAGGGGVSKNYFVKTYNYQGILRVNISSERLIIHEDATLETVKLAVRSPGNTDTEVRINSNGEQLLDIITIPAGTRYVVQDDLDISLLENDFITVDILTVSSAIDLFVSLIYYTEPEGET